MDKTDVILITGASGLVGSAVAELFKAQGFSRVACVGRDDCDLSDLAATRKLFEKIRPAYVFHAAARVYGIMGNINNQGQSYFDNTLINTSVVDAARHAGVKKITAMGSGAVYPYPPASLPLSESTMFDGRPHPSEGAYAHAKRGMLAMLEAYEQSYGLKWAYIVSCNLFGPRDKFEPITGHVVPALVRKFHDAMQSGGPVVVWGDGSAQRDFMYVKDVARVVHIVMQQVDGAINMGSGKVLSIRQIVDALSAITGITDRITWDASKPNGQDYRAYDLRRLASTGFKCKYSVEQGLQETWDWYRSNIPS